MIEELSTYDDYLTILEDESSELLLIDYWGPNCAPCLVLNKTLEKLDSEFESIKFVKVNVEKELDISIEAGVRGLPTLILYKRGIEYERWVGALSEAQLREKLKDF